MNSRAKGLLTLGIVAGGLLTAMAIGPSSAWADPPGGWGGRTYYGNAYQGNYNNGGYNNGNYNNNGGFFGRIFGNNNNGYNRPNNGWGIANRSCGNNRASWGGGPRHVAWGGPGNYGNYNNRGAFTHRRFW